MLAIGRERIVKAVVDTEPLVNALILNYVRAVPANRRSAVLGRSRVSDYLRDPILRRAFLELFDSIQTIITTSHVIGEINRFAPKEGHRESFWRSAVDWLRKKAFDERLVKLLDTWEAEPWPGLICRIGPVDAGLIKLAKQEGCHLLTDDGRTLEPHALHEGVNCKLVARYLSR